MRAVLWWKPLHGEHLSGWSKWPLQEWRSCYGGIKALTEGSVIRCPLGAMAVMLGPVTSPELHHSSSYGCPVCSLQYVCVYGLPTETIRTSLNIPSHLPSLCIFSLSIKVCIFFHLHCAHSLSLAYTVNICLPLRISLNKVSTVFQYPVPQYHYQNEITCHPLCTVPSYRVIMDQKIYIRVYYNLYST